MSGIPQLCCVGFVGFQDPLPTISLVPSHNYTAFPASWNLIAPLLLFDVSTSSVAAAQTSLLCYRCLSHCAHTDQCQTASPLSCSSWMKPSPFPLLKQREWS